jgi:hypothetical protein
MATDVEIERALATIAATLNDQGLEDFDTARIQEIVTEALGSEQHLIVDDGGGLHEESGSRVGMIRRTDSGEWITERQNGAAEHSDAAIPSPPPQGALKKLTNKIKGVGAS